LDKSDDDEGKYPDKNLFRVSPIDEQYKRIPVLLNIWLSFRQDTRLKENLGITTSI